MSKDHILTQEEKEAYTLICSCIAGDMTNKETADRLGKSVRAIQRMKRAVEERGAAGIRHGLVGKASNNKTPEHIEKTVVTFLTKKKHRDFGPTFAMEKLERYEGIILDRETVRSIMIRNNLHTPRTKGARVVHRQWREPMSQYGELIQYDGSYHDWNEDGKEECLLLAIDDATNKNIKAVFDDHEGIAPTFRFWWDYVEQYGLPVAIYLDKFGTYKVNHKSAVDNATMLSQFERAMRELGIRIIHAHSPEAKGRVERGFGTHQDRLVKELRLAGKKTRHEMNDFLKTVYLPQHNATFSRLAKEKGDAHRPLTDAARKRLPSTFSEQFTRKVKNDFTVQWDGHWFQLHKQQPTTVYRRDEVIIEKRLDGTMHIRHSRHNSVYLDFTELPQRPLPTNRKVTALTRKTTAHKPPLDHPWRRFRF